MNVALADSFTSEREAFWNDNSKDSCLKKVKSLIKLRENYTAPEVEVIDTIDRENYTIEKIKISESNLVPIAGLLFVPKYASGKMPAIIYVDGRGKSTDAAIGGIIEKVFVDSGKIVFSIDVRGFGETTDNPSMNESKHGNNEHRNAVIGLYIGKTFIGQRVEDILKATDYLLSREDVDPENIRIEGVARAGTSVLHAAAIDERYSEVVLRKTDSSWMNIIKDPTILNNMTHVVPLAMMYYDLPDLVGAISPRKVVYNPADYIIPEDTAQSGINNLRHYNNKLSNYPNPFQNATKICYNIDEPSHVLLLIYNLQGCIIKTLVDQFQESNSYTVTFENDHLLPGVYFYKLFVEGREADTKKMMVIK